MENYCKEIIIRDKKNLEEPLTSSVCAGFFSSLDWDQKFCQIWKENFLKENREDQIRVLEAVCLTDWGFPGQNLELRDHLDSIVLPHLFLQLKIVKALTAQWTDLNTWKSNGLEFFKNLMVFNQIRKNFEFKLTSAWRHFKYAV